MSASSIVLLGDARLKQVSLPVPAITLPVRGLIQRMFDIMERSGGAGLAAVQIGEMVREAVIDAPDAAGRRSRMAWVNPEITWRSEETRVRPEGCLSMPGVEVPVERARCIRLRHVDRDGITREVEADGLLAVVLQHEIDHLDGIMFIDRVSRLRRDGARRAYEKLRRQARHS